MQLYELISLITYPLSCLIPKKKKRWIFGAWFGSAASDNTKALYDYVAKNHPEIERIWVASDPEKLSLPGCRIVKRNSLGSLRYILTAQVAVMNQGFGDFAAFNFLGGVYKVQLWHGVAWKKIGLDAYPEMSALHRAVFRLLNRYDLYVAPSERQKQVLKSAFLARDSQILLCGQPRNELLFSDAFRAESRALLAGQLGLQGKKLLVYMPTFRDKTSEVFSFHRLEDNDAFRALAEEQGFAVIEKLHYKSVQKQDGDGADKLVYGLPGADAARLLAAADILITDYSSCFFDYLITDRPIIHYVYDYQYYKDKDRGLYYDIEEVSAGTLARTPEELLSAIRDNLAADAQAHTRQACRSSFISYESAHSCEQIYAHITEQA